LVGSSDLWLLLQIQVAPRDIPRCAGVSDRWFQCSTYPARSRTMSGASSRLLGSASRDWRLQERMLPDQCFGRTVSPRFPMNKLPTSTVAALRDDFKSNLFGSRRKEAKISMCSVDASLSRTTLRQWTIGTYLDEVSLRRQTIRFTICKDLEGT
jgi:hypothetical protein